MRATIKFFIPEVEEEEIPPLDVYIHGNFSQVYICGRTALRAGTIFKLMYVDK